MGHVGPDLFGHFSLIARLGQNHPPVPRILDKPVGSRIRLHDDAGDQIYPQARRLAWHQGQIKDRWQRRMPQARALDRP